MNQEILYDILKSTGMPVAYRKFITTKKNPSPNPPFLIYLSTGSENFGADNSVYFTLTKYAIELYTDKKDIGKEQLVEMKLKENKIFWNKEEAYIDDERMYVVVYNIKI